MRATRFPAQAAGPLDRLGGFVAHLRLNGMAAGPAETADAARALAAVDPSDPAVVRLALKALLAGDADGWRRFDVLFDAYWFNAGRTREAEASARHVRRQTARQTLWQAHLDGAPAEGVENRADRTPGGDDDSAAEGTEGRLVATRTDQLSRRDLRELVDEESIREAERAATRIASVLRQRRTRRWRSAARRGRLDMRRILRASLARGGEPVDLPRRRPAERPLEIAALCDVSGSMTVHSRVFIAFLRGLVDAGARAGTRAEAFLFHTRLIRVTDALSDPDRLRAAGRLSLMAEGFGGGTDIAGCLERFVSGHTGRALGRRSVVLILSDGYCTSSPERLAAVLARLRRRARRVVWLNPLLGWEGYQPVARSIAAALPYLDAHLPANTLAALGALDAELSRL